MCCGDGEAREAENNSGVLCEGGHLLSFYITPARWPNLPKNANSERYNITHTDLIGSQDIHGQTKTQIRMLLATYTFSFRCCDRWGNVRV
jgi:hypothetical protein